MVMRPLPTLRGDLYPFSKVLSEANPTAGESAWHAAVNRTLLSVRLSACTPAFPEGEYCE